MLIFCCGLMRSGSTLQYQLTETLIQKLGRGSGYGWLPSIKNRDEVFNRATETDPESYYIVKIHGYNPDFLRLIEQGKASAIYVYRDLRDVVTSFMSWQNTSFEGVIREKWIEKVLTDSQNWEALNNIHISKYETAVNNLYDEVLAIANHLSLDVRTEILQEVAEQCSLKKTQKRMQSLTQKNQKSDNQNILHHNHIKSGMAQRYKKELAPTQIALIETKTAVWMKSHGYELEYSNFITREFLAMPARCQQLASEITFEAKRSKGKLDRYVQENLRT